MPEDDYVLLICNINSAKDDEFEVFIDGKSIGFVSETGFDECKGKYFITDISMKEVIGNAKCFTAPECCISGTTSFQVVDKDVFRKNFLILTLKTVKENYNGNYGIVLLYRVIKESGFACLVASHYYGDNFIMRVHQDICPAEGIPNCQECIDPEDNYILAMATAYPPGFGYSGKEYEVFIDKVKIGFITGIMDFSCQMEFFITDVSMITIINNNTAIKSVNLLSNCLTLGASPQLVNKNLFYKEALSFRAVMNTPPSPSIPAYGWEFRLYRVSKKTGKICVVGQCGSSMGAECTIYNNIMCPPTPPVLP